jgi:TDG/mug DNA glycosylase family protein
VTRPSPAELAAAAGRTVPDVIASNLLVLFCGINPGLLSAAVGHHFAHPGNRFWKALHASGFTDMLLSPAEEQLLIGAGLGVTNIVAVATRTAAELSRQQLALGALALEERVRHFAPKTVAFLGLTSYRSAFHRPRAAIGRQDESLGSATVWVLPNPSGLQAFYPFARLVEELQALRREAIGESSPQRPGSAGA